MTPASQLPIEKRRTIRRASSHAAKPSRAALDLGVQASVAGSGIDEPPEAPAIGRCWIVGAAP
ncbi:MAG: DUF2793 domain-containing protein, partial [Methylobacterium sp.]